MLEENTNVQLKINKTFKFNKQCIERDDRYDEAKRKHCCFLEVH